MNPPKKWQQAGKGENSERRSGPAKADWMKKSKGSARFRPRCQDGPWPYNSTGAIVEGGRTQASSAEWRTLGDVV